MSSFTTISADKLARLIGTANTPALIDVRTDEDFAADPRLIPGAVRRNHQEAADWGGEFSGHSAIVVCQRGLKLSEGTAAWLTGGARRSPSRSACSRQIGKWIDAIGLAGGVEGVEAGDVRAGVFVADSHDTKRGLRARR